MVEDQAFLRDVYERDGFVHVPKFLEGEALRGLLSWVERLEAEPTGPDARRHHHERTIGGERRTRTERFLDDVDEMRAFLVGPLRDLASAAFGEDVMVFKEKLNFKHPGGAGYVAHQDAPAFPLGSRHVTAMIAIDEATSRNGGLELVAGRHREGLLPQDGKGCLDPSFASGLDWAAPACEAGDALLFDSMTPHRSGPNESEISRRILYITYSPASEGDLREKYYAERERGLASGRVSLIGHFQGELSR